MSKKLKKNINKNKKEAFASSLYVSVLIKQKPLVPNGTPKGI